MEHPALCGVKVILIIEIRIRFVMNTYNMIFSALKILLFMKAAILWFKHLPLQKKYTLMLSILLLSMFFIVHDSCDTVEKSESSQSSNLCECYCHANINPLYSVSLPVDEIAEVIVLYKTQYVEDLRLADIFRPPIA